MSRQIGFGLLCAAVAVCSGCSSSATSNTSRTAREQLLISNAVDQSLAKVNFSSLANTRVFIEQQYMEGVDKAYFMGSLRHHVLRSGASVVDKAEDADVILEPRSGGIGTDMSEKYLGIPEIALPGMLSIPEIRLAENKAQQAYAKIGLAVIDAKTKRLLGEGGVSMASSDDSNWYVMGVGPFQSGTILNEIDQAEMGPINAQPPAWRTNNVAFGSPATDKKVRFASDEKAFEPN